MFMDSAHTRQSNGFHISASILGLSMDGVAAGQIHDDGSLPSLVDRIAFEVHTHTVSAPLARAVAAAQRNGSFWVDGFSGSCVGGSCITSHHAQPSERFTSISHVQADTLVTKGKWLRPISCGAKINGPAHCGRVQQGAAASTTSHFSVVRRLTHFLPERDVVFSAQRAEHHTPHTPHTTHNAAQHSKTSQHHTHPTHRETHCNKTTVWTCSHDFVNITTRVTTNPMNTQTCASLCDYGDRHHRLPCHELCDGFKT